MTDLTKRQKEILDYLIGHIAEKGYPPTIRETREAFGLSSNRGVVDHLRALERKGYIRLLTRNLEEITSPLVNRLSRRFLKLTPAELKTCNMIRMGLSSKEIAEIRHVSPATVSRQRESIRKKLAITGRNVNLVTFLQTFNVAVPQMHRTGPSGQDSPAPNSVFSPESAQESIWNKP